MKIKATDLKKLNDAAEQIVKELASHNIKIIELDTVFEMVKEKVNRMIISNNDEQKTKGTIDRYNAIIQQTGNEALIGSVQNKIVEILNSELESY